MDEKARMPFHLNDEDMRKLKLTHEFYDLILSLYEGKAGKGTLGRLEEIAGDELATPIMAFDLGVIYFHGAVVKRNPKKGHEWFEKAKANADMLTLYHLMEEYARMCDDANLEWCRERINAHYDGKETHIDA